MSAAAPLAPALPPLFDVVGTAVFALTGALVAARLRQTFVTLCFFALLTGVGGGTLRDLLIALKGEMAERRRKEESDGR